MPSWKLHAGIFLVLWDRSIKSFCILEGSLPYGITFNREIKPVTFYSLSQICISVIILTNHPIAVSGFAITVELIFTLFGQPVDMTSEVKVGSQDASSFLFSKWGPEPSDTLRNATPCTPNVLEALLGSNKVLATFLQHFEFLLLHEIFF